jgi:hypothetical protein
MWKVRTQWWQQEQQQLKKPSKNTSRCNYINKQTSSVNDRGQACCKLRISPSSCKVYTTMCKGAMWFRTLLHACYKVHHHTKWLSSDWHEPLLLWFMELILSLLPIPKHSTLKQFLPCKQVTGRIDKLHNTLSTVEISYLRGAGFFLRS